MARQKYNIVQGEGPGELDLIFSFVRGSEVIFSVSINTDEKWRNNAPVRILRGEITSLSRKRTDEFERHFGGDVWQIAGIAAGGIVKKGSRFAGSYSPRTRDGIIALEE
jgi:hypothetical protein